MILTDKNDSKKNESSGDKKDEKQTGQINIKFRDVDFKGKAGAGDNKKK